MIKKLIILKSLFLILLSLIACNNSRPEPDKIEIGFGSRNLNDIDTYLCGAKSNTILFDIDNIQIDFYFGYNSDKIKKVWIMPEKYDYVSIVAYIFNMNEPYYGSFLNEYSDYRIIKNCYFIKEYSPAEFFTEKYAAKYTSKGLLRGGYTIFNYYESFIVPKEVLNSTNYRFCFGIAMVVRLKDDQNYTLASQPSWDKIQLCFGSITNNQIKIMDRQII